MFSTHYDGVEEIDAQNFELYDELLAEEYKQERVQGRDGNGFAIATAGYPGSGKTVAGKEIKKALDELVGPEVVLAEMGVAAKAATERKTGDEANIAEFSTEMRKVNPDWAMRETVQYYDLANKPYAVVEGVRSASEMTHLSQCFNDVQLLFIECPAVIRHSRMIDRARDFERETEGFTADALRERDQREGSWGLETIENGGYYDMIITNEDITEHQFRMIARYAGRLLYQGP
jgi:cytidylate kinase